MNSESEESRCQHVEEVALYLIDALHRSEQSKVFDHLRQCPDCLRELETLSPVLESMAFWPIDVTRPPAAQWERLARRISEEASNADSAPAPSDPAFEQQPDWEEPAPGIFCKILASDEERDRVTMLVRLAPGVEYPLHTHAGVEELHLLQGELWIDGRKLYPEDYNRGESGASDRRVWSETGCTCLLTASTRDILG